MRVVLPPRLTRAARLAALWPAFEPEWPQKTRFRRAKAERVGLLRLVDARSRSFTEATSLLPRRLRSCLPYVGAMGGAAPIWQPPLPAMVGGSNAKVLPPLERLRTLLSLIDIPHCRQGKQAASKKSGHATCKLI